MDNNRRRGSSSGSAAQIAFAYAHFERGTGSLESAGEAERLKEMIEEDLGLSLFVAREVFPAPRGEFGKLVPAGHGGFVAELRPASNAEGTRWKTNCGQNAVYAGRHALPKARR
jgi:hypothetical protein